MTRGLVTVMVAAMLLSVPTTFAQEGEEPAPAPEAEEELTEWDHGVIITDPEGDVATEAGTAPQVSQSPTGADLVSLSIFEKEEKIFLSLGLQDIEGDWIENRYRVTVAAHFNYGEVEYRVITQSNAVPQGPQTFNPHGRLEQIDPDTGEWIHADNADVFPDATTDTIEFQVSKSGVSDHTGARLIPGRELTEFYALASQTEQLLPADSEQAQAAAGPTHSDRMPDDGTDGIMAPQIGIKQTGHAFLDSPRSIRDSNGEEATFVFEMSAQNHGDKRDIFTLDTKNVPNDWEVRLAANQIAINGGESVSVPVVARVPFSHEHGEVTTFLVEMTSLEDPSAVGRIELGLDFLEIPMPAGHHSNVYMHTVGGKLIMNTVSDSDYLPDTDSSLAPKPCDSFGDYPSNEDPAVLQACWDGRLDPALSMGLDFDMARQGEITVTMSTPLPVDNAVLEGEIFYKPAGSESRDDWMVAAIIEPSDAMSIDADSSGTFVSTITPQPEADLLPFVPGSNLEFLLHISGDGPSPSSNFVTSGMGDPYAPRLEPNGEMRLPLIDYSDPVGDLFEGTGTVRIEAAAQEIQINPGETGIFEATAYNDGNKKDKFKLTLDGMNLGWASLLGADTIEVPAGESKTISLAVVVPPDAKDGERADIILEAISSREAQSRALVRLVATVDEDVDHPDLAVDADAIASSNEESPGVPVLALGALLAGLAVALRRRD